MKPYVILATLYANPGEADSILAMADETMNYIKSTFPDNIYYIVMHSKQNPDVIKVLEIWKNEESYKRYLIDPVIRETIVKSIPFLVNPPEDYEELEYIEGLDL